MLQSFSTEALVKFVKVYFRDGSARLAAVSKSTPYCSPRHPVLLLLDIVVTGPITVSIACTMGCCTSTHFRANDVINRPGQSQTALSRDQIVAGLEGVAEILNPQRQPAEIVAIGGTVNTIFLRTHNTMSDVDFFWRTKTRSSVVSAVMSAGQTVARHLGLPDNWLNNHTTLFMTVMCKYCQLIHLFIGKNDWRPVCKGMNTGHHHIPKTRLNRLRRTLGLHFVYQTQQAEQTWSCTI
jgi:hypothetical protein